MTLRFSITALIIFCTNVAIQAQSIITPKQYVVKAEEAVGKSDYNTALEYYRIVIGDHPERYDLYMNAADAAIQTHHYHLANDYIDKFVKDGTPKDFPLIAYKRGLVKKNLEEYDLAISSFEKYLKDYPTGEAAPLARKEIENCEWAKTIVFADKKYEVVHLDDKVNSIYVDAAPVRYDNTLYYTSAFFPDSTKVPVTHIFETTINDGDSDKKNPKTDIVHQSMLLNSALPNEFTAHFVMSTDRKTAYYNICTPNENGTYNCAIYSRKKSETDWGIPTKLDSFVNKPGYTSTQPSVGFDSVAKSEVLYFASNRPGGKGGLDIWRSLIAPNGNTSVPENLSDINTAGDELTPYFFEPGQVLFFSTNGYKTLGGYDIYSSKLNDEQKNRGNSESSSSIVHRSSLSTPEHGGYPLNSSYDDLYYSVSNGKAYFSSNRPGGMCGNVEKDCVCDDIYSYDLKADLKTDVFLATTNDKLKGAALSLTDLATGIMFPLTTDSLGVYTALLEFGKMYRLTATKEGYISDSIEFNTKNLYTNTSIYKKLSLRPKARITTYAFDKIDRKPFDGATITISDTSGKILVKTVMSGSTYTLNNVNFGTAYYIRIDKDKLEPDSTIVVIADIGKSDKTEYADSLYLGSFQGLPLTLYFDNDEPNPRTRQVVTDLTYGQTFAAYYNKKQEYLNSFYNIGKNTNTGISMTGANEISDFFENSIKANFEKLESFCGLLEKYLSKGQGLEIKIQGYTSPLADADYNQILSARRISSVINHLQNYHGGVLMNYINNKHLRIQLEPNGAVTNDGVSSDPKDRRNSVYGVPAMRDRRVRILEINRVELPLGDANGIQKLRGLYVLNDMRSRMFVKGQRTGKNALNLNSQEMEVVLMDSYTGTAINNASNIELYDALSRKLVGKARKKGDKYVYSMIGGTDYLVKAGASGYGSKSYNTVLYNYFEGNAVVDTMFLTPFGGLPTTLYFDNNRPGNSDKYDQSYRDFYARKGEFIRMYNRLTAETGVDAKISQSDMRLFFDAEVKNGYDNLVGFSGLMKIYLQKNYQMEVVLEGYASALSNPEYNRDLSERRMKSVINYLSYINGGVLKKYIKNGRLKITTETIGSATSQAPDDEKDPASIYGLQASHDRKVVIKDIIIKK